MTTTNTTPDVYDKFDSTFYGVSAYVILRNGVQIGTCNFRCMKNSGVVHCFFHIFGLHAAYGKASGYGYDKVTASFESAVRYNLGYYPDTDKILADPTTHKERAEYVINLNLIVDNIKAACKLNGGTGDWDDVLTHQLGFTVLRAI